MAGKLYTLYRKVHLVKEYFLERLYAVIVRNGRRETIFEGAQGWFSPDREPAHKVFFVCCRTYDCHCADNSDWSFRQEYFERTVDGLEFEGVAL